MPNETCLKESHSSLIKVLWIIAILVNLSKIVYGSVSFDLKEEIIMATKLEIKNQETITTGENQNIPYGLLNSNFGGNYLRV